MVTAAMVLIWFIGASAALNQIEIAPEIVNGLFYAVLAIIAGVAIVSIGGGDPANAAAVGGGTSRPGASARPGPILQRAC